MRPAVRAVALAGAAALLLAACGSGGGESPTPAGATRLVEPATAEVTVLGLCQVRQQAQSDPITAEVTFYDRSHEGLHLIAGAVEVVDRAAAARLLQTKQRVESDLMAGGSPSLPSDVDVLLEATRDALAALGLEAPACPS
jgi:hypothetical protein